MAELESTEITESKAFVSQIKKLKSNAWPISHCSITAAGIWTLSYDPSCFTRAQSPECLIITGMSPTHYTAIWQLEEKLEMENLPVELETWNLNFEWAVVLAKDIFLSPGFHYVSLF